MRSIFVSLLLLFGHELPPPGVDPPLAHDVTIYRDSYGVPHVFGKTDAAAVFGFAYAQAEDNLFRIEDNYIRSLGRRAEVDGESGVRDDQVNHLLEIPRLAREEYARLPGNVKALVDAFAEGLNWYLTRHPEVHPRLLGRMEPWYPLAFIRYNYYQNGFLFSAGLSRTQFQVGKNDRGLEASTGSNGWVIGASRSASGHPMLFINPHLAFFGPGQVYEGHVHSEQGWDFTGYTRFGFPFPYVGHNADVGWVSTDNGADQADSWMETFDDPTRPLAYRYGDGYRMATAWQDTIRVKTDSGLVQRITTLRKTHHGPLFGGLNEKPLAVRMAKIEADGWIGEWYAMTRARNLVEMKRAMAPLNMLFGNVMYADRDGHTWYLYNGAVPRRKPGLDWQVPVDGSDPSTEWQGYHTMEELPQLTDPATGWMQNCNTSPFLLTSAGNPDSTRFPGYMVPDGDNPRGVVSRRILADTPKWTFEQWTRIAFDTRVVMADSLLPMLLRDRPQSTDTSEAGRRLHDALDTLMAWNHRSDTMSVATTLFVLWQDRLGNHPQALAPQDRLQRLVSALDVLQRRFGRWMVRWGEINRLQRIDEALGQSFSDARPSVAVPGVSGADGAVFTFYADGVDGQKARYGQSGGTYISVVEFGPQVHALTVHTMGASGHAESPHFFDQAPLYASGRFKPGWFTLAEVGANAERTYRPGEEPRR
ncbi:MAG: penicillin acylase family protein [Gemmatimonadota bacterium]